MKGNMNDESAPLPGSAFYGDISGVSNHDMLDNRKSQPGAAQFPASGCVHTVKPFKQP